MKKAAAIVLALILALSLYRCAAENGTESLAQRCKRAPEQRSAVAARREQPKRPRREQQPPKAPVRIL
jgi:hypothetical protein